MTVDPLAEIVTFLKPRVCFSKVADCYGPWRIRCVGTGEAFFCAVLEGGCRVLVDGRSARELSAGDFLLVPALQDFTIESRDAVRATKYSIPVEYSRVDFA